MDPVSRAYAHTAWTPNDPLQNLAPEVLRALLIMPSTFRERLRFAPWVSHEQRREAMTHILAERRLAYELATPHVSNEPMKAPAREVAHSPYYQARLQRMETDRRSQDLQDWRTDPRARADFDTRAERRERFAQLLRESVAEIRDRQDELKELQDLVKDIRDVLGSPTSSRSRETDPALQRKGRTRRRERERSR